MRDARPHIFLNLNGSNLLTLVLEEDGTVTERPGYTNIAKPENGWRIRTRSSDRALPGR